MLVFCDSADHYTTATQKWTSFVGAGGANVTVVAGAGRFGDSCLSLNPPSAPNSSEEYVTKGAFTPHATWIVGTAFQATVLNHGATKGVLAIVDGSSIQVDVRITSLGQLQVTRNGTILATGTTILSEDIWYYIEFKATIHNTTGSYELRINGVAELTATNVDTQNTSNATANVIWIGNHSGDVNSGTGSHRYSDIYVCDGSGATNNDFLGDVRVEYIEPEGNGNSSQFLGSDGNSVDNYLLVDEAAPNSDTDYVESSTVGQKDTYVYDDVTPTTGSIFGVQIVPFARKTDAGTRTIASVARLSGTEVDSAAKPLSTTYQYLPDIRETKPGGGAWSLTDVNNAEFGVKVVA